MTALVITLAAWAVACGAAIAAGRRRGSRDRARDAQFHDQLRAVAVDASTAKTNGRCSSCGWFIRCGADLVVWDPDLAGYVHADCAPEGVL